MEFRTRDLWQLGPNDILEANLITHGVQLSYMCEHLHADGPINPRLQIHLHRTSANGHASTRFQYSINLLKSFFFIGCQAESAIRNYDVDSLIRQWNLLHVGLHESDV